MYGLIFLFKWVQETDDRPIDNEAESKGVFFASQVIENACATQAIVSVLMNRPEINLGQELSQLKEFTSGFPPDMKGLAIGNSSLIRSVHNSFAPPQPLVPEEKTSGTGKEDAFHFIAYVPVAGALYELDGLKPGPIRLADTNDQDWLSTAAKVINERIGRYAAAEVRFNLMAVVRSKLKVYSEQMAAAQTVVDAICSKLNSDQMMEKIMELDLPMDRDTLAALLADKQSEVARLKVMLGEEEDRRERWRLENCRRRTDFTPLIFQSLKALAQQGKLKELIGRTKTK